LNFFYFGSKLKYGESINMKHKSIQQLYDFSGKVAVITGAAKGIGFGMAERLAEAGAKVVISDIDDKTGKAKAAVLEAEYIHADVSDEKDIAKLINQAVKKFSRIDIWINNAGIFPSKPALEMDLKFWEKIQAVNLRSVFLCSRDVSEVMKEQGGGVIINIGSIDSLHPSRVGLSAYDASKHGVWGFTKNFALEVAPYNIRVNAIAPGGISTEGVEEMTKGGIKAGVTEGDAVKDFTARIPLGKLGEPDDIAMLALYLASDASKYMTGSLVVVDGGYLLT